MRISARQKSVFKSVGMPALRTAVSNLSRMIGGPQLLTRPYYEDWSMRSEVLRINAVGPGGFRKFWAGVYRGLPRYHPAISAPGFGVDLDLGQGVITSKDADWS